MEPLRVGFIGGGSFATWTLYPALHLAPIELIAVCDQVEERARSVAGKFGTGRWYADFRRMWEQEDLEAIIISMGPGPRQPLVSEALQAGYHVLVPKPPALSLAEAEELAETARRTGKTLMVNFQRRFSFGVRRAREIMTEPSFGSLSQLSFSFCSGPYDERRSLGYEGPLQAYLLDFAIHHFDLARYLGGEIEQLAVYHNPSSGGGSFAVALQFQSGAVGTLQLNSQRIWWRNYDRVEITGQGEYIVLDGLWTARHYARTQNTFTENYSDERSGELTGDGYALNEFVQAIREGSEPIASIYDCVKTMRLYQAVYDAALAGRQGEINL